MKKISLLFALVCSTVHADYNLNNPNCFGTSTLYSCSDPKTGNRYNVNKIGDSTYVQANNYHTGSSWSQTTHSYGNMSQTNGFDKNGNTWRHNTNQIGDTTYFNGTDSNGSNYNGSCNQFGCNTSKR